MKCAVVTLLLGLTLSVSPLAAKVVPLSFEVISDPPAAIASAPVAIAPDPIERAARDFAAGQPARIVETADFVAYPYGQAPAKLECLPLRVCLIELEAGETLLSTVAGDTERWTIQPTFGGADGKTPLVAVKPQSCDTATNLILVTTRRIYDLELRALPCKEADKRSDKIAGRAMRRVRFYDPVGLVRTWARREEIAQAEAAKEREARTPLVAPLPLEELHFGYRWSVRHRFPWQPLQVFDDGRHVYLHLPDAARRGEAPLVFLARDGKATDLLSVAVRGDFLVTDRLFEEAVLVIGDGKSRKELSVRRIQPAGGPR